MRQCLDYKIHWSLFEQIRLLFQSLPFHYSLLPQLLIHLKQDLGTKYNLMDYFMTATNPNALS